MIFNIIVNITPMLYIFKFLLKYSFKVIVVSNIVNIDRIIKLRVEVKLMKDSPVMNNICKYINSIMLIDSSIYLFVILSPLLMDVMIIYIKFFINKKRAIALIYLVTFLINLF